MVGFVIVSHSETLANGVVELTKMMADGVPIRAAGGLDGGGFGTSYEKISNAIDEIYSDDGVIVLMDMGSAVMTAEMVLEAMPERKLVLADCPLVEGAVAAVENPAQMPHLPLDIAGTAFQQAVWRKLCEIPAGRTSTYAAVAAEAGRVSQDYAVLKDQYDKLLAEREQAALRGQAETKASPVRIALIDGGPRFTFVQQRLRGYTQALRDHGIAI